ncbi:MAG: DUF5715 family protein [Gemmatimonadaceae bacterium]
MSRFARFGAALALASATFAGTAQAAELGGSLTSMKNQHDAAVRHQYTFLRTPAQVREYVAKGRLVQLTGNADYSLFEVSFPYARAEVRMFVERLAADYRAATSTQLVVTSLTRPEALQPRNAHQLSVHPAGMAVDFRVPEDSASRRWLERTLLAMEKDGLLDATRERRPPHYHVAVFARPYRAYAEKRDAADVLAAAMKATSLAAVTTVVPAPASEGHAQFALPLTPLLGGAASGLVMLALFAVAGAIGRRRRGKSKALFVNSAHADERGSAKS